VQLDRLQALEEIRAPEGRAHQLVMEEGETVADMEERRHRMIAEGKADAADLFIFWILV
jgi:hypothetical protein